MRNSSLIDSLLPRVRQQVLTATLLQPDRSWYLSELAHFLNVTPSTLQRELSSLSEAGILTRQTQGNRIYFQANGLCPILPDLQALLIKTAGVVDLLKGILKPVSKRVDVAFIFGSFAEGRELVTSDIDLLVIGNVGLSKVAPLLRTAEERLNRPVNPVMFSREEALKKLASKNHFIETVRKSKKLYLWGEDSDLGKAFS